MFARQPSWKWRRCNGCYNRVVRLSPAGKRHTVRVSPMAPLSAVIEAALSAEGVTANTAACRLLHGTKALDAATPLRFANLPAAAKLELITGRSFCASGPILVCASIIQTICAWQSVDVRQKLSCTSLRPQQRTDACKF